MEFDIYIPKYNLCFEFQDAAHYITTWYKQETQKNIQEKDNIKKNLAYKNGLTLVCVPCWWDGMVESLISSIEFHRPDITLETKKEKIIFDNIFSDISLNPPPHHFEVKKIPEVEELMLASFPPLSNNSFLHENIWWIGEKYDGIRCCWHPSTGLGYSRYGKVLPLLPNMTSRLPQSTIDSEIWFGRGQYLMSFALVTGSDINWPQLRIISFDVPDVSKQNGSYEDRYKYLFSLLIPDHPFLEIATRAIFGVTKIEKITKEMISGGGEGVILQKYNSQYDPGRSENVIKLKSAQGDQEAVVVKVEAEGVNLKLPIGTVFFVPSKDIFLPSLSLCVGDIVSFSYESHVRREIPKNPKIFRKRSDLVWDDVTLDFEKELNKSSQVKGMTKPKGYWTPQTMRQYLENFAKNQNLDPLSPSTWYNSFKLFIKSKSGRSILGKFKKGYYHVLQVVFPEVKFDPAQQYGQIENRKMFFENLAKSKGIDSLMANDWYQISLSSFMQEKGIHGVISYHNNSISKALSDLFPNIGLDRSKFTHKYEYVAEASRRKFFENYAKLNGFDPLLPDNWYKESESKISSHKGAKSILFYHDCKVSKALMDLFPEIGLKTENFSKRNVWDNEIKRREFFEKYAQENNFDAHNPENWYSVSTHKLLEEKGFQRILKYHNNSLSQALCDLFPSIGLDRSQFQQRQKLWNQEINRRNFFESYAIQHNYNPLVADNWYSQNFIEIMAAKGAKNVISYHGNSLATALQDLFPEIIFDSSKFPTSRENEWENEINRVKFFENFAHNNGFDPLNPENWYQQPKNKILTLKGAHSVLGYYNYSLSQALLETFPNIETYLLMNRVEDRCK